MDTKLKMSVIMAAVDKITAPIKKVTNSTAQLTDSMKASKAELDKISGQKKDIEHFKGLKKAIKSLRPDLTQQQQLVNKLSAEYDAAEAPTAKMSRELNKAKQRLQSLRGELRDNQQGLRSVVGRMADAGIHTNKLSDHTKRLDQQTARYNSTLDQTKARLRAVADHEKRLQALQDKRSKSMQLASNTAVAGAGMMYASTQARQAISGPLQVAAQFEAQMSKVGAISRASTEELAKLTGQSRQLGAETVFSASEVANAQEFLAVAGYSTNQILAATPATLQLAQAGQLDLARAADIASDAMGGFNMQVTEMGRMSDVLALTSNTANTNVNQLGEALKTAAPVAGAYKGTIEQVSGMLGIMANVGVKGSQAGTAVAAMYARLSAPPKEGQDALEQLGVEIFDLEGKMRAMPDIIQDISAATQGMADTDTAPLLKAIFGAEAGIMAGSKALLQAAEQNKLGPYIQQLEASQGAAGRVAQKMTDNLQGTVKEWDSAMESMKISAGNALIPTIKELTQWVTGLTRKVDQFAQNNPTLVKWLGIAVIAFAGITAVLGPLMILISTLIGGYATLSYALAFASMASARFSIVNALSSVALRGVAVAQWLVNAAMAANPIGLVIAAVVGLVALAAYLIDDWGAVGEFFSNLWAGIQSAFSAAIDFVMGYILKIMNPFESLMEGFRAISDWWNSEDDEKTVEINKRVKEINEAVPAAEQANDITKNSKAGPALGAALTASVATMPAVASDQLQVVPSQPIAQNQSKQVTVEGDKFEITLATSPGMDNQEIAAMLRREIERHETEKQRKLRGALNDND